jgi:hypothetical protein
MLVETLLVGTGLKATRYPEACESFRVEAPIFDVPLQEGDQEDKRNGMKFPKFHLIAHLNRDILTTEFLDGWTQVRTSQAQSRQDSSTIDSKVPDTFDSQT